MLTLIQAREYNRFKKLSKFFSANGTVITSFVPFETEVVSFNQNLELFDRLIPNKDTLSTVFTTEKTALKHTVADELAKVCKKTKSYAIKNGLTELAAQTNVTADDIMRLKDGDILGYAQQLQTIISPQVGIAAFAPYNITAATLNDIVTDASRFNALIGKAGSMASTNTTANNDINTVIKALQGNIEHFDLLIDEFETDNADFAEGYVINSSVDNIGTRHSGIKGTVTARATGLPLANIRIVASAKGKPDKETVTDINGEYSLIKVLTAVYTITASGDGVASQTIAHHILRGRIDEVDWEM